MLEILSEFFERHPDVTQKDLAKVSNVSPTTISRCRRQFFYEPSKETREKILYGIAVYDHLALLTKILIYLLFFTLFLGGATLAFWLL